MADIIKGLFGGKPATTTAAGDFADFATAATPAPASFAGSNFFGGAPTAPAGAYPYTKWYRVWERTSLADFKAEAVLIPLAALIFLQLVWGRSTNRKKARNWMAAHAPILEREFASVGFDGIAHGKNDTGSLGPTDPSTLIKEKTATEFAAYATGRQNVAFVDVKINLYRRFNPLILLIETLASWFLAFVKPPKENVEVVIYTFDGQEKTLVPTPTAVEGEEVVKAGKVAPSGYDGFVWAIVHKDFMKEFRSDRYDASLTDVKDNSKLPAWATVMSESAEITDAFLTPELTKAVETAGHDLFEYLLISDMPADKPTTIDELEPRKRLFLSLRLPSGSSVSSFDRSLPIFSHFMQLPDDLVKKGRFRAEVTKKLKRTRDDEIGRVKRATDDEKAEERKADADKRKKQEREELLRTMSPAEQRKYLDKERDKQNRKSMRRVRA